MKVMMIKAVNKYSGEQRIVSDRELDKFDIRVWRVEPCTMIDKEAEPTSVVLAYAKNKEGSYKKVRLPIFKTEDLNEIYISASSHLILKNGISPVQREWMELNNEGFKIMGL
jgi:hypothetical protein